MLIHAQVELVCKIIVWNSYVLSYIIMAFTLKGITICPTENELSETWGGFPQSHAFIYSYFHQVL